MSKKKKFLDFSTEELIERILDNHNSIKFEEVENTEIGEYMMFLDDKEILKEISIRACLLAFFDL